MNGILHLDGIVVRQGDFQLGPVTLSIRQGEHLVLMGPSGCGKTTLLKAIAGFIPLDAGSIRIGDRVLGDLPPEQRRVGYVPQSASLFPHLRVRDNIRFGLAYAGIDRDQQEARFNRITGLLGVEALLDRRPATLSGGEARRVALARSLVTEPDVLLLDEPLGMLDTPARHTLVQTLKSIHAALGTPTIHVTHHLDEAWMMGGLCSLLREGRLVQTGPVETLLLNPANAWAQAFLDGGEPRSTPGATA